MSKVLSLGAIAMDIVINSLDLPHDDGFGFITGEAVMPGGSASNVSVACAGLGMDAFQTGQIGDDTFGDEFRRTLIADGVDDSYVITRAGGTTLHTYILTAPGGRHCIFANLGDSVNTLDPAALPADIMNSMDIFYCDMFSPEAALCLAESARRQDKPVVYNMQCVPSFMKACGIERGTLDEMMGKCTLFVSGRDGYTEMTGEEDTLRAMQLMFERYKVRDGVVYTAGSKGAYWYDGENMYHADAFTVDAVDTTGAGDCFIAGLMYAFYDKGSAPEQSLRFANATAAVKCTIAGPRSRSSVSDVQALIDRA